MSKKLNLDTTLGEFVAQYPQVRNILENYELDYCCGGKKNIKVAAKEKNIDLNDFELLLEKVIDEAAPTIRNKNWTDEPLVDLVDYIQNVHHALTWEKLASMEIALKMLVHVHGEKHGEFLQNLENIFKNLKTTLEKHLKIEEDIVFAYVRDPESTNECTNQLLEELENEHIETSKILNKIKIFTSNYELPDDACASFAKLFEDLETLTDDLHIHIHLENTVLFPRMKKTFKMIG